MKREQTEQEVKNINSAFDKVSASLKLFNKACAKNGSPLRGVTYRVLDNGETRLHVRYKRGIKKPEWGILST